MGRWTWLVLGFVLFSFGGVVVRADDEAKLAEADTLLIELASKRKAWDIDALRPLLPRLVAMHNGITDAERRKRLQASAGAFLRSTRLAALHADAIETLLALDDPSGTWRQLRSRLPREKSKELTDVGREVLIAVGRLGHDPAIPTLRVLGERARVAEVRRGAILALGQFGASKKRVAVAHFLLRRLSKLRRPDAEILFAQSGGGWREVGSAILAALRQLTGRDSADPRAWLAHLESRDQIEALFRPAAPRARGEKPPPLPTPWRWLRIRLAGDEDEKAASAVEAALRWLQAHQSPHGAWEAAGYQHWCDGEPASVPGAKSNHGLSIYDTGVTGLALTAFLVAGYDGSGTHAYDETVRKGLGYLVSIQDPEGCFGPRIHSSFAQAEVNFVRLSPSLRVTPAASRHTYVYNHATAALALIEAYALTGDVKWKKPAQRALDFIALARNPYFAFRYGIKPGDNDTSVLSWMMLAFGTAHLVNRAYEYNLQPPAFVLDPSAIEGGIAWLQKVTDPDYGRVGYVTRGTGPSRLQEYVDRFPAEKSENLTAAGMFMRCLAGEEPRKSKLIMLGADLCRRLPPTWNETDGSIDMIYWHFGTLALSWVGGKHWDTWKKALRPALLDHQRQDGDVCGFNGSWDSVDAWAVAGGRVYATALNALTLLTPRRFPGARK